MPIIKQRVIQGGADTFTTGTIDTNIAVDGKSGWKINGVTAYWEDAMAVVVDVPWRVSLMLSTQNTVTTALDDEEIARLEWVYQNSTGVAGQMVSPIDMAFITPERVTVQPYLYLQVDSSATGQANQAVFVIEYELVKLSDLEVLRLLAGGA